MTKVNEKRWSRSRAVGHITSNQRAVTKEKAVTSAWSSQTLLKQKASDLLAHKMKNLNRVAKLADTKQNAKQLKTHNQNKFETAMNEKKFEIKIDQISTDVSDELINDVRYFSLFNWFLKIFKCLNPLQLCLITDFKFSQMQQIKSGPPHNVRYIKLNTSTSMNCSMLIFKPFSRVLKILDENEMKSLIFGSQKLQISL